MIEGADLSKKFGGKYVCPECNKRYHLRWIRRHLIEKHEYKYWDGTIIYKPKETRNE